jgi:hypothetical protein
MLNVCSRPDDRLRACPAIGRRGYGIRRSATYLCRLRWRVHLHCGRATLLLRQTIQERPQALQALQVEARSFASPWSQCRLRSCSGWHLAHRDAHHLLGVRDRNHSSLQANTGTTRAVQGLLLHEAETSSLRRCTRWHGRARPGRRGSRHARLIRLSNRRTPREAIASRLRSTRTMSANG